MSPINLHDFFLVTARIIVGTLLKLKEHDNAKRAGPAQFTWVFSEIKLISSL